MKTARVKVMHGTVVAALALAAVTVSGCTAGPDARPTPAPAPSARNIAPTGAVTVGCDVARAVEPGTPPPTSEDLVFGPLVLRGLADGYHSDPVPEPDADGVTFFKIGTELAPASTATISVDPPARGYAGILTERGPSVGYSRVTYASCSPTVVPGDMWWVGGFTLVGRTSACVPLSVSIAGETTVHHIVLPIETTSCPST